MSRMSVVLKLLGKINNILLMTTLTLCCLFPLAFVVVGVLFMIKRSSREDDILIFNDDVDKWEDKYRGEMESVGADAFLSTFGYLEPDEEMMIDLDSLRDTYDDPEIKSWDPYYFSINSTVKKSEVTGDFNVSITIYNCENGTRICNITKLTHSSLKLEEIFSTRYDEDCDDMSSSCIGGMEECQKNLGVWKNVPDEQDNCYWYYRLDRYCVLVDPMTLEGAGVDKDATSYGCFREQVFIEGEPIDYSYGYYELMSSGSWDDYNVSVEVRSPHDMTVILSNMTMGTYQFGDSEKIYHLIGLILVCCAMILTCFILCYCCIFPIKYLLKEIIVSLSRSERKGWFEIHHHHQQGDTDRESEDVGEEYADEEDSGSRRRGFTGLQLFGKIRRNRDQIRKNNPYLSPEESRRTKSGGENNYHNVLLFSTPTKQVVSRKRSEDSINRRNSSKKNQQPHHGDDYEDVDDEDDDLSINTYRLDRHFGYSLDSNDDEDSLDRYLSGNKNKKKKRKSNENRRRRRSRDSRDSRDSFKGFGNHVIDNFEYGY